MKYMILMLGLWLPCTLAAQTRTKDQAAVEKQVEAIINSWNRHDYSDMPTYATEDCDWVNIVGMWWQNRKEVEYAHEVFHKGMFRDVTLKLDSVKTRVITPDVILARVYKTIGAYKSPSGTVYPKAQNLLMLLYVKKNGKWLLTAGQNVVVNEAAQKSNPVNKLRR
ncbi:SgcJ/EcaC family oxidoreductase [Emticicia fluvialis]|uniref:SgcJ/EcaC family oxidoreductase n=1 Tax=Emticicia fluvialis TaxID=2974474 RepID=UPI0021659FB3|nr:SgcJ/EcaC family oxidoreductase [Emticicia fluvialis]